MALPIWARLGSLRLGSSCLDQRAGQLGPLCLGRMGQSRVWDLASKEGAWAMSLTIGNMYNLLKFHGWHPISPHSVGLSEEGASPESRGEGMGNPQTPL